MQVMAEKVEKKSHSSTLETRGKKLLSYSEANLETSRKSTM